MLEVNPASNYVAIYDFELLPYALGDVLTWNVQTAIRGLEAGRERVDVYVCIDPRYPASIYQRGLVTPENCGLFFNELFGAFGTHPMLGDIQLFSAREELLAQMRDMAGGDPVNSEVLSDYETVLGQRSDEGSLNSYFIKYIYSHAKLNAYGEAHGGIPLLGPSHGCEAEVADLLAGPFAGRRIVVIHPRLRRLDAGIGGDHTYFRDSDFLEWFEFVRLSEERHPDVQFVVMGRLQEKPLELLRRPNVTSLRALGLSLGHELTLMCEADLFIGTSSGFAAMANFCTVPYFITHMNKELCNAYAIPEGSERLPFAAPHQFLVYDDETTEMLLALLERGLALPRRVRGRDRAALSSPEMPIIDSDDKIAEKRNTSRYFYSLPSDAPQGWPQSTASRLMAMLRRKRRAAVVQPLGYLTEEGITISGKTYALTDDIAGVVENRVEVHDGLHATGWAVDYRAVAQVERIVAIDGAVVVAAVAPSLPRPDIEAIYISGRYPAGFAIEVTGIVGDQKNVLFCALLADGTAARLALADAVPSVPTRAISGALDDERLVVGSDVFPLIALFVGQIELARLMAGAYTITGWAADQDANAPVRQLVGVLDKTVVTSVPPSLKREDIMGGIASGANPAGFSIVVPPGADGQTIAIYGVLQNGCAARLGSGLAGPTAGKIENYTSPAPLPYR